MSLGPPFDDSGASLQRVVGASSVLVLLFLVALMLSLSGRTLGSGGLIHVRMATPGMLRDGAKVRVAGREVGEVRGISPLPAASPADKRAIEIDAFIEREWLEKIPVDSEFFISTPSILGEAYLEVGATPNGRTPSAPLTDGAHVRGVDPPEIDRFLEYGETNLRLVLAVMHDCRPEFDALMSAVDSLIGTLSGIETGRFTVIEKQFEQMLEETHALLGTVREAGGFSRIATLSKEIYALAEHAAPELHAVGTRIDVAMTNLAAIDAFATPERKALLLEALSRLRHTVTIGEKIVGEVQSLVAFYDQGKGTIGGIIHDKELYDDLHEAHRILKSQPWSLILKTDKPRPIVPAR